MWLNQAKNGGWGLKGRARGDRPVSLCDYLLPAEKIAEKIFMLFYIRPYYNRIEGSIGPSHSSTGRGWAVVLDPLPIIIGE